MAQLSNFITEILTGEYGLDVVGYGKDINGDFQPFKIEVDGTQYVIDEQLATKLDTLIAKDFATETTLDIRLSNLETKIDSILSSHDTDNNFKVSQNGRNVPLEEIYILNAFELRSTNHLVNSNLSRFKNVTIWAISTTDVEVTLNIKILRNSGIRIWDGTAWTPTETSTPLIPAYKNLNSKFQWLNELNPIDMTFEILASTAPTSGSVTILVWGVPN